MKANKSIVFLMTIILLGTIFGNVNAQGKNESANQQEMMAAYMELAKPGPEHKLLESLVGAWNLEGKIWMQPGAEPMSFTGVSENKMVLGGRFLQMASISGEGDMYTETLTLTGFDRRHKKYVTVGLDTWGTYYVTASGSYDKAEKKLTMYGEDEDPVMKMTQKYDFNFYFKGPDKVVSETVFKDFPTPSGIQKEYKMVEIVYTRK